MSAETKVKLNKDKDISKFMIRFVIGQSVALIVIAVGLAFYWSGSFRFIQPRVDGNQLSFILLSFLSGYLAFRGMVFARRIPRIKEIYEKFIGPGGVYVDLNKVGTLGLAFLYILPPIGEELLLRGVLQVEWGIAISSIIFAALHWVTATFFILMLLFSVIAGTLYHQSDFNIIVPIIFHFTYNFFVLNFLRGELRVGT